MGDGPKQHLVVVAEPVSAALLLGTGGEVPAEGAGQPLAARRAHGHAVIQAARGVPDHAGAWGTHSPLSARSPPAPGTDGVGLASLRCFTQPIPTFCCLGHPPSPCCGAAPLHGECEQCHELLCPPRRTLPPVRFGTCSTRPRVSLPAPTTCILPGHPFQGTRSHPADPTMCRLPMVAESARYDMVVQKMAIKVPLGMATAGSCPRESQRDVKQLFQQQR